MESLFRNEDDIGPKKMNWTKGVRRRRRRRRRRGKGNARKDARKQREGEAEKGKEKRGGAEPRKE